MPPGLSGCQRPRTESTFAFRRRLQTAPFPRASEGESPRAFKKRKPGNACNSRAGEMPRAAPRALTPDPNPAKPTHYDSDVTTYARTPSPANGKNASIFPPQPPSSPERGSRLPNPRRRTGSRATCSGLDAWSGRRAGRAVPRNATRSAAIDLSSAGTAAAADHVETWPLQR